ncbi:terminase small subunit [Megasphaera sp.]|uniref:terminase small subunit n=1 Tax=Megasphaera sp. TaxID=2023260 RepID=UPI00307A8964
MKLTEKQKRFVDYFIELGDMVNAARKAGYSNASALDAPNWLNPNKPQYKAYLKDTIGKRLQELKNARTASLSEVLEFMTSTMRGELKEDVVVTEGTGEGCSEARVIQKQVSARDRLEAAKALEKRLGRFIDLEKEEQQLKNEKLRAEVADLTADNDEEDIIFEFSREPKAEKED